MSNFVDTMEEVKNYIYARTPLIIIQSSERERVERMLTMIKKELTMDIYYYTDSKQVVQLGSDGVSTNADSDPMAFMSNLFRRKHGAIFAFGDVRRISEDTMYTRDLINVLYLAKESSSTLILITNDKVIQKITQFGMISKLDYPDDEERCRYIRKFAAQYDGRFTVEWDEGDISRASTLLRGFTEIQIENILSNEIVSANGLFKKNIYTLAGQKSRLYSSVSSIQQVSVDINMESAGLENLKQWLEEKRKVFFASDSELERYGLETPKGILLTGVPGCGKSYSAKMVAAKWELPLFRFDIGSVYDKWMGESERKMKEALDFIDNVSPCVLWVDEIEKALAVSDGGNDTSRRILGLFLFWLQESKSRVFITATANDITRLPSELFRKGRFSEVFFIDLPTPSERRLAIKQYAGKCLHVVFREEQLEELVKLSEGFSFAEIEYAIKDTAQQMLIFGPQSVNMKTITDNFAKVVPISIRNGEIINSVRTWGYQRAISAHRAEED